MMFNSTSGAKTRVMQLFHRTSGVKSLKKICVVAVIVSLFVILSTWKSRPEKNNLNTCQRKRFRGNETISKWPTIFFGASSSGTTTETDPDDWRMIYSRLLNVLAGSDDYEIVRGEMIAANRTPRTVGDLTVFHDYVSPERRFTGNESVTLCTHATVQYFRHILELCERWKGPISVSVFSPRTDLVKALILITKFRNCEVPCIRRYVSWHLMYPTSTGPACLPAFQDAKISCDGHSKRYANLTESLRDGRSLAYPVNVCRNVARQNAKTHYVMVSDVELYPSDGIIPRFLAMPKLDTTAAVYALAIFEIDDGLDVPRTKPRLVELFAQGKVIYFHKWICPQCQFIPRKEEWIKVDSSRPNQHFSILTVAKRQGSFRKWEPVYIGTKDEPEYTSQLSWDGKSDKMSQAFEMCLMDYKFAILNGPFLCHSPGVKQVDKMDESRRAKHIANNYKIYRNKINQLTRNYEPIKRICT